MWSAYRDELQTRKWTVYLGLARQLDIRLDQIGWGLGCSRGIYLLVYTKCARLYFVCRYTDRNNPVVDDAVVYAHLTVNEVPLPRVMTGSRNIIYEADQHRQLVSYRIFIGFHSLPQLLPPLTSKTKVYYDSCHTRTSFQPCSTLFRPYNPGRQHTIIYLMAAELVSVKRVDDVTA